ncbi:hypothetical protein J437_LFUL016573 [Ladona fulva]|uniref:Uncharacterized protein n=1 Tax=Ladona fulva TaxID=123851 RepID=A0A8K0KQP9_LADFU|nr:hypothetical protein J437_LFUL016573 [Ladona fulva]
MIAETLNIPKTIVHELLTDKFDMRKECTKLVPKLLTDDQKNPVTIQKKSVATELLERPDPPTVRTWLRLTSFSSRGSRPS